jgi:bla regulator protein BlaR1
MKLISDIFSGEWSEALVWTLIHSLWQGIVLLIALVTVLRFVPGRNSSLRYITSVAALAMFVASSIITCSILYDPGSISANISSQGQTLLFGSDPQPSVKELVTTLSTQLYGIVASNSYLIAIAWMIGAFLFSLRMVSGFLYVSTIKKNAVPLQEEWVLILQQLTDRIGVTKTIALAESLHIKVPFVVGFFKPIILLPVGMITRLSTQQVEAILVHELMHIKRNDYLVNVAQSVIESIFFFNPFVWIISSLIRREREHCCDDEVVKYGDALSYAYALTRIEELNINQVSPALSLADNKNQLLKRIRRIMEKSVQNYSVKERIVPVVLLIVGLICASWFSIRPAGAVDLDQSPLVVANDTPKSKKSPKAYSKRKITMTDREGNPVKVVEVQSNDDSEDFSFNYDFGMTPPAPVPPIEPMEPIEPMMMPMTPFAPMAPMEPAGIGMAYGPGFYFNMNTDTTPGVFFRNNHDWETFSQDFQSKFREKFADFYKKHGVEMDKMMKEMGDNFKMSFDEGMLEEIQREAERAHELSARHMEVAREAMQRDHQFVEERARMEEQRARHAQTRVEQHQEMLRSHEKQLQKHQEELRVHEERMKKFEKEMKEELIRDGYLGKDEQISNMHWKDNEKIEINGKEIKKEHQQKYHELHRKYFERGGSFRYVD